MHRNALITAAIAASFTAGSALAGERLSGDELGDILIGNTEEGTYEDKGKRRPYWEFYKEDGNIKGKNGGRYSGKYEIRADGCFYATYDYGDEDDGCYYYERLSDNTYYVTGPNDFASEVTISEGDPKNLDRGY